jgi:sugar phosphate isomerase/epimerase
MENRFAVTVPYAEIVRLAPILKEKRLDIEVEIQDSQWLLRTCEMSSVRRAGDFLRERGIAISVSGPVFDLNPGSFDEYIRDHTRKVFLKTIDLARNIGAARVVLPSGYTPFLAGEAKGGWRSLALDVWRKCAAKAGEHDIVLCLENWFEESPAVLLDLLSELGPLGCGACLSVGHANVYSKLNPGRWMKELGELTKEIHLSDNDGKTDGSMALGEGTVDLAPLAKILQRKGNWPALVLEMDIPRAEKSMKFLEDQGLFSVQQKLL